MAEWPGYTEFIVEGDLNVDLEKASGRRRDEEIAVAVATACLEDLVRHFLLQRWA